LVIKNVPLSKTDYNDVLTSQAICASLNKYKNIFILITIKDPEPQNDSGSFENYQ